MSDESGLRGTRPGHWSTIGVSVQGVNPFVSFGNATYKFRHRVVSVLRIGPFWKRRTAVVVENQVWVNDADLVGGRD